jgi:hypothetical protein
MFAGRTLTTTAGAAIAVLCLSGCQEKLVAGVTFSANGSVAVTEVSTISYDDSAGQLTVAKPDPAKLLAAAKKGTHAFAGEGVGRPAIKLVRLSKHTLRLVISQKLASLALLNEHGGAFDAAALSLDVSPAKGPRTEKVTIEPGITSDPNEGGDTLHVTHVGHTWSFVLTESAKGFAQDRKSAAAWASTAKKAGLSPKLFAAEFHVKLPGKVVSTNGKRLAGGAVSWDLLHLASPELTVSTKD